MVTMPASCDKFRSWLELPSGGSRPIRGKGFLRVGVSGRRVSLSSEFNLSNSSFDFDPSQAFFVPVSIFFHVIRVSNAAMCLQS